MQPGDRIERYVVEALLGEGGMGQVYLAFDDKLQRRVALKVMKKEGAEPAALRDILREARAAAALQHPNAVAIHDVVDGEWTFIVMEHVEGSSLREASGASQADKVAWLAQTADALAAAHARGLVHRDVKPENIMITRERRIVKLLDFGIAKLGVDPGRPGAPSTDPSVTDGYIKGTPRYMSPEQASGDVVDERTDVFAWGVVAYELLVGIHPADLRSKTSADAATLPQGARRDADFADAELAERARDAGIPKELIAIVLGALALSPAQRTPSMATIIEALARKPPTPQPEALASTVLDLPSQPRSRRWLWPVAGAVVVGAAMAGYALVARGPDEPAVAVMPTCRLESTREVAGRLRSLIAVPDGAMGLSDELAVHHFKTTGKVATVVVHDRAPADSAWLGLVEGAPALFAQRVQALTISALGDTRTSTPDHLFGGRRLKNTEVVQLRSTERDSAAVVVRSEPDEPLSTAVMPLDRGCGRLDAVEIAHPSSLPSARAAAFAFDARRLAVVQPNDSGPATLTTFVRAPAGSAQPCALTLEGRIEIRPIPMGLGIALVDGGPWITALDGSYELILADLTRTFTHKVDGVVIHAPKLAALGRGLVVAWHEEDMKKPDRIMIAPATTSAGFGAALALAEGTDAELVDVVTVGDRAFVLRATDTQSVVHQLRCD